MTERELKAMYENASLPEDRMAELEKRFISKVEAMPQDAPLAPVIDEESAHVELKPAPRRPLSGVIGVCAAAAAMVALVVGITFAYKGGYIGTTSHTSGDDSQTAQTSQTMESTQTTQTAQTSESVQDVQTDETSSFTIRQDMLPEYPNKGSRHNINVKLDDSLAERAAADIESNAIAETELFGLFTVVDWTEITEVEGREAEFTCYTMTVNEIYYSSFSGEREVQTGDEFKVYLYGMNAAQYDGCPPLDEGDRIAAALRRADAGDPAVYVLSAEYALADVLTIDGVDYAAVRSSVFPAISMPNIAGSAPLERVTTCLTNPARYYRVYDLSSFGTYFWLYMDGIKAVSERKFDVSAGFGADAAAMQVFEQYFSGRWKHDNPWKVYDDYMTLAYTPYALYESESYATESGCESVLRSSYRKYVELYGTGDSVIGSGAACGGFMQDGYAAYMEVTADGVRTIYVVPFDTPEIMYSYVTDENEFRRENFDDRWRLERRLSSEEDLSGLVTRFGLMKALSGSSKKFADMVWSAIESDFTDENGAKWSRYMYDEAANAVVEAGYITLNAAAEDSITISLPFFSSARETDESGNTVCPSRSFCFAFKGFSCTRTLSSGEPARMESYYSPLETADGFPSPYTRDPEFANGGGITVEYYAATRQNGLVDVYAVRDLGYAKAGGQNICEIYHRDPLTDKFDLIDVAYSPSVVVSGSSAFIWYTPMNRDYEIEGDYLTQYDEGMLVDQWSMYRDYSFGTELYVSGKYILARRNRQTSYEWAVFVAGALSTGYETYADGELTLTKDGFTTTRDGKTIVYDAAGENLAGMVQYLTAKLRSGWSQFVIDSPSSTGNRVDVPDFDYPCYEIANPEWRTREGLLAAFGEYLTPAAAEEALAEITGHSVVLYNGQYYTPSGARGSDLSKGRQEYSAELSEDGMSGVVTYIVHGGPDPEADSTIVETYTIGAVKTENGWRLDRFYQPY